MLTLAARSGEALVQLANAQGSLGSVLLILVAVLLLSLVVRDYLAAAVRPEARPEPLVRLNGRLYAQRSGARRRAWALEPSGRRPLRYTVVEWVGTGYVSPAIRRFRARRAFRDIVRHRS